ncbi:MAG: MerR family transcriptional regulator [Alphaproteobacteria bacterium]|jgi:DNA-binding transcriptional MerR regulator|nr:MerR family transcriptional regulator [Alphaproteobacteria bacterium]
MAEPAGSEVGGKSPQAFRTISEVARELDVAQHVLRFWEGKFPQIKPMKRGGGRRYYRPEDIDLLRGIQQLLYGDGYTIKGVQRLLRERGARTLIRAVQAGQGLEAWQSGEPPPPPPPPPQPGISAVQRRALEDILAELVALSRILERRG